MVSFFLCLFVLSACVVDVELPPRYAILYGVSEYTDSYNPDPRYNPYPNLNYSGRDAEALYDLLTLRGFDRENVILRQNSAATKAQLLEDIAALAARAEKDSLFLFYYSGHGGSGADFYYPPSGTEPYPQDAWDEYLIPYGSFDPAAPSSGLIKENMISDDELMLLIARMPSRQKVVVIDACNSGGFIGDSPGIDLVPPAYDGTNEGTPTGKAGKAFAKYFANAGEGDIPYTEAIVIAAAGEREVSWEAGAPYNHGIFTYYLLETPKKADKNGDGWVTVSEAYAHTRNSIAADWNREYRASYYYSREEWFFLPHISGGALDFALFPAD
jgi:hypothetical protein